MKNIESVLVAGKTNFENIFECSCLLADLDDYADFNSVYAKYFSDAPPARAAF